MTSVLPRDYTSIQYAWVWEKEETGKVEEFTMGSPSHLTAGALTWNYIHNSPCMFLSVDLSHSLSSILYYVYTTNRIHQVWQALAVKQVWNRNPVCLNAVVKTGVIHQLIHAGFLLFHCRVSHLATDEPYNIHTHTLNHLALAELRENRAYEIKMTCKVVETVCVPVWSWWDKTHFHAAR